jgi:hypothetical protein
MLNVLYTVDTELWPWGWDDSSAGMQAAMDLDIRGHTSKGNYGVQFQIDLLDQHGLTGVFLVESLFASAKGTELLRQITDPIRAGGHEVQLHLHTEWLDRMPGVDLVDGHTGQNMADFSEPHQTRLIEVGLANLQEAGNDLSTAFRAGNYGADNRTLPALARNGVKYDTSYNYCHLGGACRMDYEDVLLQPVLIDGVIEVPVNHFRDRPGGLRHTQLMACSFAEMRAMLLRAHELEWHTFVIVSHSFELINRVKRAPDMMVIRRFERLCQFLAENTDRFRVCGFNDLGPDLLVHFADQPELKSNALRTLQRVSEQALRRFI